MIRLYHFPVLTLLGLLVLALCSSNSAPATTITGGASPEITAEEFYRWYLRGENYFLKTPVQKATFRKYVTARLRRAVAAERDVNLFLSAQNIDPGWQKNITVSGLTLLQQKAIVTVTLTGEPRDDLSRWVEKLKVGLVQEAGSWKIDEVSLSYSSEDNK